jgi:hypothetical protein
MSAVASTEFVSATPALEVVGGASAAHLAEQEMYRWMIWLGVPSLVAAIFMAGVFATGSIWWIGGALTGVIGLISVVVWLAMSTCTNQN